MPVLRIHQHPGGAENRYRIEVTAEDIPGFQTQTLATEIDFALSAEERASIRWYLEDFLEFDQDPAPQIARRVEALLDDVGATLFRAVFSGPVGAIQLWTLVQPHLASTRIEVTTGIAEATAIPWELIRDPDTGTTLALSAQCFVRTQRGGPPALAPQGAAAETVRILLVISRPTAEEDVPFRSVAGRLVTRLGEATPGAFDLDVLRPPTYQQLAATLRLASEAGRPYHIVHFDGHGVYADPADLAKAGVVLGSLKMDGGGATGAHGFLVFESPQSESNSEFVDGFKLGGLLRDCGVPLLVINACQSAFAEAAAEPEAAETRTTRQEVAAYGSLAQAVMDAGAAGVVAMRYAVYVVTAAQFVEELYGALARGRTLGEAVAWARKNLADQPERHIAYEARPLQDWSVPVVWERASLRLWPAAPDAPPLTADLAEGAAARPGVLDPALPARPDVGFFGRDETLHALDRAFDTHPIVLLHAYAGSGKTATAAEFARWYALTGGIEGPVLFSPFERHLPLARLLDKIGEVFGAALQGAGVQWHAITDMETRRDVALQVLRQVSVLWIWDNVEPVTGFPAGTESAWSAAEQQELRAFLAAVRETKAKILLTSRRDERVWLEDLPRRVAVPPMPMRERLQLAGALVAQRGGRLAALPDLRPLLRFTRGNPLTILVTVGEALRSGIDAPEALDAFVDSLRRGEAAFADEATENRAMSLGASLAYGFARAFDDGERKVLALLHLFQGFVDVDVLRWMGNPEADWCLAAVRGLTRERGVALLDRAAEIGLLGALGGGYYAIHPALPWFFRDLFQRDYSAASGDADRARRAFAEAMGDLGNVYHNQYNEGHRDALSNLAAEEDNLLAAWRLALDRGWWESLIGTMQGLRALYGETGRTAPWRRLVEVVVPVFVDPATDRPLPGHEGRWSLVTAYRVDLARKDRDWPEAERLLRVRVDWNRDRAQSALAAAPEIRDDRQRNDIRSLAVSLHELAEIQRQRDNQVCADTYRQSLETAAIIGDVAVQASVSRNLGNAYKDIADLRNLDEAERWYRRSLDLLPPGDTLGRGQCLGNIGNLMWERFLDARSTGRPAEELSRFLTDAVGSYEESLRLTPETAVIERGVTHNQLGNVYLNAGDTDRALHHYRQDIRYCEQADDFYGAGQTRFNVALTLFRANRTQDARAYAVAALANYESFGDRAADKIAKTKQLIAAIDQAAEGAGAGA